MANVPISNLTTTWNNVATTFNGIKLNVTDTASAAGSLLMDLQVGGSSKFKVTKAGVVQITGPSSGSAIIGSTTEFRPGSIALGFQSGGGAGGVAFASDSAGANLFSGASNLGLHIAATVALGWTSGSLASANDLTLFRDAANTLSQRNGVNAQTFRLYNTFTDASNYERGFMRWNTNVLEFGHEFAGTGTVRVNRYYLGSSSSASYLTRAASSQHAVFLYNGVQSVAFGAALQSSVQNSANGVLVGSTSDYGIGVISGFSLGTEIFIAPSVMLNSNRKGANLNLIGGAASTVGNWNGGDIVVRGGTANGTGAVGNIIMDNLPTSNPGVTGALWNNLGILSIA